MKTPRRFLLLFSLSLPLVSCSCESIGSPPTRPHAPPPEEASVKPGINDDFLGSDVDLEKWRSTFESETREIAANKEAIVASMKLKKGQDIVDVGAGTGLFIDGLAQSVGIAGKVYALDISPDFVEALKKRTREQGLEQVEVRLSKPRSVELPALSVDAAFVCDTYHHFEYPQHVLFSLYRAIRPRGILYVVDFERIPGTSRPWILEHVRADKRTFIKEIEQAGFLFEEEVQVPGLEENYLLRFRRP